MAAGVRLNKYFNDWDQIFIHERGVFSKAVVRAKELDGSINKNISDIYHFELCFCLKTQTRFMSSKSPLKNPSYFTMQTNEFGSVVQL